MVRLELFKLEHHTIILFQSNVLGARIDLFIIDGEYPIFIVLFILCVTIDRGDHAIVVFNGLGFF